jgi:hypothetical protein
MNWLVLISGLVAAFCTVGHFAIGSKQYLIPMLQASFDDVPRKMMHCVFHYVSVYLVLSTIFLIAVGFGYKFNTDTTLMVKFVAINFTLFAVTQLIIAATSKIQSAVFKMFQWIIFVVIAVFAWLGA